MALQYNSPVVGGYNAGFYAPTVNRSVGESQGTSSGVNASTGGQTSQSQSQSTSFIPNYSQTPILESIAQWSGQMAPQVYNWAMDQFANNQGQINQSMNIADIYASPAHIAANMGQAEAGVQQGGEQALENNKRDLQSYGIDPSSGRYAALDEAARVQTAASAAGAGNQQRTADINTGNEMRQQAISSSLQNASVGTQGANAARGYADTGMSLKYSPLGSESSSASTSQGYNASTGTTESQNTSYNLGAPSYGAGYGGGGNTANTTGGSSAVSGGVGWPNDDSPFNSANNFAEGGAVDPSMSPSDGRQTDDVPAQIDGQQPAALNAGEFVIPKDVAAWKGQEFFFKLMEQSRANLAKMQQGGGQQQGYNAGGDI